MSAAKKFRAHDPNHPYVMRLVGCGHGRLFTEPCVDCEIVQLLEEYRCAARTIQRVRDRLRVLGAPRPRYTSRPSVRRVDSSAGGER